GEAPLVVVPRTHFDQRAGDLGQAGVNRAGSRGVIEVNRNQGLVGEVQDALQSTFRSGSLEDGVDFVHRSFASGHERQVDQRNVNSRNANSVAVKLAVQFGQNQTHSGSRTGFGGDHAGGSR